MKLNRRWIRLDANYRTSAWLIELSGHARRLWPDVLCMVKTDGTAGRVRGLSARGMARLFDAPESDCSELLAAAVASGAIEIAEGGDWIITAWHEYQDPQAKNAERQQRFRERHRKPDLGVIDGGQAESA
jgi:hypothetical protein